MSWSHSFNSIQIISFNNANCLNKIWSQGPFLLSCDYLLSELLGNLYTRNLKRKRYFEWYYCHIGFEKMAAPLRNMPLSLCSIKRLSRRQILPASHIEITHCRQYFNTNLLLAKKSNDSPRNDDSKPRSFLRKTGEWTDDNDDGFFEEKNYKKYIIYSINNINLSEASCNLNFQNPSRNKKVITVWS